LGVHTAEDLRDMPLKQARGVGTVVLERAAEKLRQHGLVAGSLTAFYNTSRFRTNKPQHRASRTARLTPMSNDTFDLVNATRRCAEAAWRGPRDKNQGGFEYAKAGVMLDDVR